MGRCSVTKEEAIAYVPPSRMLAGAASAPRFGRTSSMVTVVVWMVEAPLSLSTTRMATVKVPSRRKTTVFFFVPLMKPLPVFVLVWPTVKTDPEKRPDWRPRRPRAEVSLTVPRRVPMTMRCSVSKSCTASMAAMIG